jgi:hypothetical protein
MGRGGVASALYLLVKARQVAVEQRMLRDAARRGDAVTAPPLYRTCNPALLFRGSPAGDLASDRGRTKASAHIED